ncbi:MAG: hypothetical protein DDT38_01057 [Firmicutes bacterium]|nr:hypothetical protein [candidate division NPL-UPA2 bacterium]
MPAGFEKLYVWQDARKMTKDIYKLTAAFPVSEQYGLVAQIRRASVSVMSNIAEGHGRFSRPEFLRFMFVARGSLWEVSSLCILGSDLGYLSANEMHAISTQCDLVGSRLGSLIEVTQTQVRAHKVARKL